jgi:hypothetical protein
MKDNPILMMHYLTTMLLPWLVIMIVVPQGVTAFGWNPTVTTHHPPRSSCSSRLEMVTFPIFETHERDGSRTTTKRMMPTRPKPSSYQGLDGVHHLFTAEHHKYVYIDDTLKFTIQRFVH